MVSYRGFLQSKVARRILTLFVLSALVPITATALLSMGYVRNLLIGDGQRQLHRSAKFYGESVLERLLIVEQQLQELAAHPHSGDLANSIADTPSLARALDAVAIVSPDGTTRPLLGQSGLLRSGPALEGTPSTAAKTRLFSKTGAGRHTRILMSVPITTPGQPVTWLVAALNSQYLWGKRDELPFAANICVLEYPATVLFCSESIPDALFEKLTIRTSRRTWDRLEWSDQSEKHLAAAWELFLKSRFSSADWIIVASQREADILMPVQTFNRLFPLIVILSLLFVALLSVGQIRRSLVPLARLIDGTQRVANRNFDQPVEVDSQDEFEQLAVSFNTMTRRLARQFSVLNTLADIDQLILGNPDIDSLLGTILRRIKAIVPCDGASITLLDQDSTAARTYLAPDGGEDVVTVEDVVLQPTELTALLDSPTHTSLAVDAASVSFLAPLGTRGVHFATAFPVVLDQHLAAVVSLGFRDRITLAHEDLRRARDLADRMAVALSAAAHDATLYRQAHFDPLTGLPNRQLLNDRLTQEIGHAQRGNYAIAVLFIDLDRFKTANDTLGHAVGDKLLQQTAARISECVRESDTVARLGGDEFTVVLSSVAGAKAAGAIAENIISALSQPFFVDAHEIFLSASVGITFYPDDGHTSDGLLRNADAAMYRAKSTGRGQYRFFEERMNIEDLERTRLERDLRHALQNDELSLVYQPIVDLASGQIIGAEALIRWHHPSRGEVAPATFIPVAEETGFVTTIGEWVLQTACAQYVEWRRMGLELERLAVNFSIRQFLQNDVVAMVKQTLKAAAIPPGVVELEITESLLMDDRLDTLAVLEELHANGILLSIDDFGTGYSSLSYLKRLPVDTLKIDRAFMQDVPRQDDATSITRSIIALGHTLKKTVIAEGIETVEQLALLRELRCDLGQGFHFSKPLPAREFTELASRLGGESQPRYRN